MINKILNKEIISGIALDSDVAAHYINGDLKYTISTSANKHGFMVDDNEIKIDPIILL